MLGAVAGGAVVGGLTGAKIADDRVHDSLSPRSIPLASDARGSDPATVSGEPYGFRDALRRLYDLQVAYELVDDFPNGALSDGRVGTAGWTVVHKGTRAGAARPPVAEGGVVELAAGSESGGRCGMHMDMGLLRTSPHFTMEWRVGLGDWSPREANVFFGVLDSVEIAGTGLKAEPSVGQFFRSDRAVAPNWQCVFAENGKRVAIDSKVVADNKFHRFGITSDSTGLVRFYIDDRKVAIISGAAILEHAYGHGIQVLRSRGSHGISALVDWFYLRRESPR